jgi:hypothetical protein
VDCPVFGRIRRPDNDSRGEESSIPDRHAGFNAASFGLNGWRNHTAVGAVLSGNNKELAPEQGICLLFNGGKIGIKVNVHD